MINAKEEILKLKDGGFWIWPESDYGKAEVWFKYGTYFLFEIPSFGGRPEFYKDYTIWEIEHLINVVRSWIKEIE